MDDRFKAWLLDDDAAVAIHRLASLAASAGSGSLQQHLPADMLHGKLTGPARQHAREGFTLRDVRSAGRRIDAPQHGMET